MEGHHWRRRRDTSLVGNRLYVFSRQDGNEITRCLNAADGKELWVEKYESLGATGPAQGFSGPRSSPAVASGKVVTLGVRGMLSCLDAATGKMLWRKDEFRAWPNFHPSSSPMIVDGLVIAQLGGRDNGALVAYDLTSGNEKWKMERTQPGLRFTGVADAGCHKADRRTHRVEDGGRQCADGKLAWESDGAAPGGGPGGPGGGGRGGMGGGRDYKAATPIVDGQTIIIAGRGVKAVKLAKDGAAFVANELWNNPDKSVQFNTPALKNGMLYGLTGNNELFCIDTKDGKTTWSAPLPGNTPAAAGARAAADRAVLASQFLVKPLRLILPDPIARAVPADPVDPEVRADRVARVVQEEDSEDRAVPVDDAAVAWAVVAATVPL